MYRLSVVNRKDLPIIQFMDGGFSGPELRNSNIEIETIAIVQIL